MDERSTSIPAPTIGSHYSGYMQHPTSCHTINNSPQTKNNPEKIKKFLKKLLTSPPLWGIISKSPDKGDWTWKLSSAGRASALQAEGHRFEPYSFHHISAVFGMSYIRWSQMYHISNAGQNAVLLRQQNVPHFSSAEMLGPVVQLVRTLACHARGRRFEPDPGRHLFSAFLDRKSGEKRKIMVDFPNNLW